MHADIGSTVVDRSGDLHVRKGGAKCLRCRANSNALVARLEVIADVGMTGLLAEGKPLNVGWGMRR